MTSQHRDFITIKAFILFRIYNSQINVSLRWSPSWNLTLWQHSSSLKAHYKIIKFQWQISLVREKGTKSADKLGLVLYIYYLKNLPIVLTIIFDHSTSSSVSLKRKRWINKIKFASRKQLKSCMIICIRHKRSAVPSMNQVTFLDFLRKTCWCYFTNYQIYPLF